MFGREHCLELTGFKVYTYKRNLIVVAFDRTDISSKAVKGTMLAKSKGRMMTSDVDVKATAEPSKSRTRKLPGAPMTSSLTNQQMISGQLDDVKGKLTSAEHQLGSLLITQV